MLIMWLHRGRILVSQQAAVSTNLAARSTWLALPGRFAERSWHRRYRRAVATAFATVPYYRERWSLTTTADPVDVTEATARAEDLVPLRGGAATTPPFHGLREALRLAVPGLPARAPLLVLIAAPATSDEAGVGGAEKAGTDSTDSTDSGVSGAAAAQSGAGIDGDAAAGSGASGGDGQVRAVSVADAAAALSAPVGQPSNTAVVGTVEELAALRAAGVDLGAATLVVRHDIRTGLPDVAGDAPAAAATVLHDDLFRYLGASSDCGRWHLLWRETYVRTVVGPAGRTLAFTAPSQRSPRLVDITLGPAAPTRLDYCPSHGTPTVSA